MRSSLRKSAPSQLEPELQLNSAQKASVIRDLAGGAGVLVLGALAFVLGAYGPQGMFLSTAQPAMAQLAARPATPKAPETRAVQVASNDIALDVEPEQVPLPDDSNGLADGDDEVVQEELIHDPGAKTADAPAASDDPWAALDGAAPPEGEPPADGSQSQEGAPPQAGQDIAPLDGGLAPLPEN